MIADKQLFLDDIKGLNGVIARDVAIMDIEKYLDYDYTPEQLEEMDGAIDELKEEIEDLEIENEKLEKKVRALETNLKKLSAQNRSLRIENLAVGDLLDKVVIEQGIDIFGGGLRP